MLFTTRNIVKTVFKLATTQRFKVSKVLLNTSQQENLLRARMEAPKYREIPEIMKLDTPEFKSIFSPELESLVSLFKQYGFEIRIAGGAVRDLLMGKAPKDLDFATTATPDEMKDMFTAENIRMINMKGEKHGTITPRINDLENFEVTTLRIDVVTDGRHAEVQYTTDWLLDANRRDLTINSMFLGLDGTVYDYFFGYEDLKSRRVAFVGSAEKRIQEDYLRILRYFRFYGRIAEEHNKHNPEILEAITVNASGLEQVSGERIWTELKKILEGNFAGEIMETMINCGLAKYCGLNENANMTEFRRVWARSKHLELQAITVLAAFLRTVDDAAALHARLKLSAYERDLAVFLVEHRGDKPHEKPLLPYQQLLIKSKGTTAITREWIIEVLKYRHSEFLKDFENWEVPKFPVNGNMVKEKGVPNGKMIGHVLNQLKAIWADNDFASSADELLSKVPDVMGDLNAKKKDRSKH